MYIFIYISIYLCVCVCGIRGPTQEADWAIWCREGQRRKGRKGTQSLCAYCAVSCTEIHSMSLRLPVFGNSTKLPSLEMRKVSVLRKPSAIMLCRS